jgi:hypothetical protein
MTPAVAQSAAREVSASGSIASSAGGGTRRQITGPVAAAITSG